MYRIFQLVFAWICILSTTSLWAQEATPLSVTLDDIFRLADENNRTLKVLSHSEGLAATAIEQSKQQLLPSLDATLSLSYNGDGRVWDRHFKNGMHTPIPSFGNNFAFDATQIIYAGGAIKSSIAMAKLGATLAQLDKANQQQEIRFLLAGYYL